MNAKLVVKEAESNRSCMIAGFTLDVKNNDDSRPNEMVRDADIARLSLSFKPNFDAKSSALAALDYAVERLSKIECVVIGQKVKRAGTITTMMLVIHDIYTRAIQAYMVKYFGTITYYNALSVASRRYLRTNAVDYAKTVRDAGDKLIEHIMIVRNAIARL